MDHLSDQVGTDPSQITHPRLTRLHRLAMELTKGPVDKFTMIQRLEINLRTFYRDLIALEELGLNVVRSRAGFSLLQPIDEVEKRLPFPTPNLNLSEARTLAASSLPIAGRIEERLRKLSKSS